MLCDSVILRVSLIEAIKKKKMIFQVLEILKVVLRITIKQAIKICLIVILKNVYIIFNTWKIKIFKYLKKN